MSRADIFLSTAYFLYFSWTTPWVKTVKWWIDSCGIGRVQQGSISEWRRGVFTPLPSLHLASPQPRLGRQLQVSAYWVWQRVNWPSAAIVSHRTITEQAYKHTDICSSGFFFFFFAYSISHCSFRSRLSSEHPAWMCETDHWDAQRGREPTTGLYCALIVPKPSKCQRCLQGMPVVCVCLFSVCLRVVFLSLRVTACYGWVSHFSHTGDTPLWSCRTSSVGSFLAGNTVCICVVLVHFAWNKMREWTSVLV